MKMRFIIMIIIVCVSLGFSFDSAVWQKQGFGIYESDIQTVFIDPGDESLVFAGTSKALYRSADGGRNYQLVLRPSGESEGINQIYVPIDKPETVYAATDAGLYESSDRGRSWERIYHSADTRSRICLSVLRDDRYIYLGTQKGLFQKSDGETSWRKVKGAIDGKPVYTMAADQQFLYIATGQTLFRLDRQTKVIKNIFSLGIGEERGLDDESDEAIEEEGSRPIKFILTTDSPREYIFVASSKGIYFSSEHGKEWEPLPARALALDDLTSLVALESDCSDEGDCREVPAECFEFLAGTKKGVFSFVNGAWMPVYKGMETNTVSGLAKSVRGAVYAATEKGIFYLPMEKALPSFHPIQSLKAADFDNEPTIREVHQLAIDYAEVSHEKIKNWRRLAQRSAWLPDLDVGVDGGTGWSSSDSIWGSYTSGGQHYVGPDDKTRREDFGWDVSLSWNLSDLVWSSAQTSIDSRSKLMVELREDILNEVTRLYFERRRIQAGLVAASSLDPMLQIDQEMRVAELTALIDALTGGEFSKRIH